jgi:hypothetical protein
VPELSSLRPVPLAITVAALVMVFRLRWSVPRTLAVRRTRPGHGRYRPSNLLASLIVRPDLTCP